MTFQVAQRSTRLNPKSPAGPALDTPGHPNPMQAHRHRLTGSVWTNKNPACFDAVSAAPINDLNVTNAYQHGCPHRCLPAVSIAEVRTARRSASPSESSIPGCPEKCCAPRSERCVSLLFLAAPGVISVARLGFFFCIWGRRLMFQVYLACKG